MKRLVLASCFALSVAPLYSMNEEASHISVQIGAWICAAQMHHHGIQTQKDYAMARDYYAKLTEQTENLTIQAGAYLALGSLYYTGGYGLARNYRLAHDNFTKAAAQIHNPHAQFNSLYMLGEMYHHGLDVQSDPLRALCLFSTVANQSYDRRIQARAHILLSEIYYGSEGVKQDIKLALQHIEKALSFYSERENQALDLGYQPVAWLLAAKIHQDLNSAQALIYYERAASQGYNLSIQTEALNRIQDILRMRQAARSKISQPQKT